MPCIALSEDNSDRWIDQFPLRSQVGYTKPMSKGLSVVKASGIREPFSESKVRRSIRRVRIPASLENQVVRHVREKLYDGIPTQEIYKHIREFLGSSSAPYSKSMYGLKQAIMQLGPSGFPFEKYIARVLEHHGFLTRTNVIAAGKCVQHEVDVVAEKDGGRFMIECKFHNRPGSRSDVKVALYVQARFEDLERGMQGKTDEQKFSQPWLVTNTKFTTEAIAYGECVGMWVVGWSHPESGDLQSLIESGRLHPVTCLTTLTEGEAKELLRNNIVMCKQILSEKDALQAMGFPKERRDMVEAEVNAICSQER